MDAIDNYKPTFNSNFEYIYHLQSTMASITCTISNSDNNMASKTILKTNTLTVAIIIELILWITLSTIFGYLVGDHWYHLDAAAIVGFIFATLTTLAMLG